MHKHKVLSSTLLHLPWPLAGQEKGSHSWDSHLVTQMQWCWVLTGALELLLQPLAEWLASAGVQ